MMQECKNQSPGFVNVAFSLEEGDDVDTGSNKQAIELTEPNGVVGPVQPPTDDEDEGGECGWLFIRPKYLQIFRNSKWVLFMLCWASAVQGMLINGFINVIITTIEKRFSLTSANSGLIPGFYDIGAVLCSIPVSYLGSLPGASKPRWLGWGLLIMGLGSFVFTIPHFASPHYDFNDPNGGDLTQSVMVCLRKGKAANFSLCQESATHWLSNYQYVFFLGQLLHGVGASPLYILGIAYLDESVPLKWSSFYLGIFNAMSVVGPAFGYVIGGQLLNVYIDYPDVDPDSLGISTGSEQWLGAWWLGFLLMGSVSIGLSWIVMAFPAELPGAKKRAVERAKDVDHVHGSPFARIQELPKAFKILLKNVTFVCLSLAESSEAGIMSGCATFMPKIIENQFGYSAGFSAMLVGIIAVPGGGGATFLGGYIVKRLQMTCKETLRFCLIVTIVTTCCCFAFFGHCPETDFAGVNIYYDDRLSIPETPVLKSECNAGCSCDDRTSFDPICGVNGVMYFSPCHAGCSAETLLEDKHQILTSCSCISSLPLLNGSSPLSYQSEDGKNTEFPPLSAMRQKCPGKCNILWIYLLIFFVVMVLTFLISMPSMSATLRCVPFTHRSLALGIQGISFRMLGTIPGPVTFGALVMDTSCYLWQPTCDGVGACRFYNNYKMAMYLLLSLIIFKFISIAMYFLAWKFYQPESQKGSTNGICSPADEPKN